MKISDRGLSLMEALISSVIFVIVAAGTSATFVSLKQLSMEIGYRYTALNIGKELLEWGEAASFSHPFRMKYYYHVPTICTIPETGCDNYGACREGLDTSAPGYKLREWWFFCNGNPQPFMYLGDILLNGLVPRGAPDSVQIYYKVEQDASFSYNPWRQTVEISWQENAGSVRKRETLSVIPIRAVNNQLTLSTTEFWWE